MYRESFSQYSGFHHTAGEVECIEELSASTVDHHTDSEVECIEEISASTVVIIILMVK